MQNQNMKKLQLNVNEDEYKFLVELIENAAFELESFSEIKPGDRQIALKAKLAETLENTIRKAGDVIYAGV